MRSMETTLAFDALEQALHARGMPDGLTHHSDWGSQYLSLRYSARLEEAGVKASVGTRRLLRQRTGGKHHWPVQDGNH